MVSPGLWLSAWRLSLLPAPKSGWWWLLSGKRPWRHQNCRVCRPLTQFPVQAAESGQEESAHERRERWRPWTQLHLEGGRQPQLGVWAPQGAGRGGHGDPSPQLSGSSRCFLQRGDRQGLPAPGLRRLLRPPKSCSQLPAPRKAGEAEKLVAVAVKAKGFLLFPGIAGKCSLPMAGSPASGAERGLGCPLPRWSSLCRTLA